MTASKFSGLKYDDERFQFFVDVLILILADETNLEQSAAVGFTKQNCQMALNHGRVYIGNFVESLNHTTLPAVSTLPQIDGEESRQLKPSVVNTENGNFYKCVL